MVTNGFRMLSEYANAPCIGKRAVGVMKKYFVRIWSALGLTDGERVESFYAPQTNDFGRPNEHPLWETAFYASQTKCFDDRTKGWACFFVRY